MNGRRRWVDVGVGAAGVLVAGVLGWRASRVAIPFLTDTAAVPGALLFAGYLGGLLLVGLLGVGLLTGHYRRHRRAWNRFARLGALVVVLALLFGFTPLLLEISG